MGKLALAYALVCGAAALAPLLQSSPARAPAPFPGWPDRFEGRALARLPDPPEETAFYAGTAVQHARFSDGRRIVILRWADSDLGGFHLSEPCFRAYGYAVGPTRERSSAAGHPERCFVATRAAERLEICEHIRDARERIFSGAEQWRLEQLLGRAEPPFWGVSVVTSAAP